MFAVFSVMLSRKRPIMCSHDDDDEANESLVCSVVSGIVISGSRPGATPKKPGGVTPITVNATLFMCTILPMAEGSRPKRRRQHRSLMTATGPPGPPPMLSSPPPNVRPAAALMPRVS